MSPPEKSQADLLAESLMTDQARLDATAEAIALIARLMPQQHPRLAVLADQLADDMIARRFFFPRKA